MDIITNLIIYMLAVFALSSGWLYSELPKTIREWWLVKFAGRKLWYLAICQLCCSFWFALLLWPVFFLGSEIIMCPVTALAAAGFSWMLGAFTQNQLWQRAYYERLTNGKQ